MKAKSIQNVFIILLILFVIFSGFFINGQVRKSTEQEYTTNLLRVDTQGAYLYIQNQWPLDETHKVGIINSLDKSHIKATILSLSGEVLFSNKIGINSGDYLQLKEILYMDQSYMKQNPNQLKLGFPIEVDEVVVGFVVFEKIIEPLGKSALSINMEINIVFGIILLVLLIIGILAFKKDQMPLEPLITGLENIAKGILKPCPLPVDKSLHSLYITYNLLVEELSYILKQQQAYDEQRKTFLTMISHELKTPISTINAYVEALLNGVAKDEETKTKYQKIIHERMQMLIIQIDELFQHAQEDSNHFKYNLVECYADDLFKPIFYSLREQKQHPVQVEDNLPKCLIKADSIRIEQVIMNFFNNAMKHSELKEPILIRGYRQDNEIMIEVEDFGKGILSKDLPHIFDSYYQGNVSKKTDYQGVGLGLSICKEIVEEHGGKIMVKSKINQGTKMVIVLPVV